MAVVTKATLKTYFQDGKEPDENKFINLIDTMVVSGAPSDFIVGDGIGGRSIYIDGEVGGHRNLIFQTAGVDRWRVRASNVAETGGNAGTEFEVSARKDDGTWLHTPIRIIRSTGDIYFSKDTRVGGGLYVGAINVDPVAGMIETTDTIIAGQPTGGYIAIGPRSAADSVSDVVWWSGSNIAGILRRDTNDDIVWQRYNPAGTYVATSLILDSSTGDVYTVPWTQYTGTTVVGFSSPTVIVVLYKKVGKTVFVQFALQGNSNTSTLSFTLPFNTDVLGTNQTFQCLVYGINNGSPQTLPARLDIPTSGKKFNIYKNLAAAGWSTSGIKGARGVFSYQSL
jgi:hypothetical protein